MADGGIGHLQAPTDSKILGQSEVDVTDLENYITEKRKKGIKVTLTQVLTLAAARALRTEVPELNVYLRRGKIVKRPSVDAMVSVLLEGSELGSVKVPHADEITIDEMALFLASEIKKARGGNENKTMEMKGKLAAIPGHSAAGSSHCSESSPRNGAFQFPNWA